LAEKLLDDPLDLNMKGFLIGNPGIESDWYYNVNEYAFVTYMWSHALIPAPEYLAAHETCGWASFFHDCKGDFTHPTEACRNATKAAVDLVPDGLDLYSVLAPTCHSDERAPFHTPFMRHLKDNFGREPPYEPCVAQHAKSYMNRAEVIKAVHANIDPNRRWPSTPEGWYYNQGAAGEKKDMKKLFPRFFDEAPDWKIWVVSGDADAAVPFLGTERWMECLGRELVVPQEAWMMDGEVAGTKRVWDRMTLLTVKGCGHTIPTYCPKSGYKFFADFLEAAAPVSLV